MNMAENNKRIVIEPVTRVEGHGKVTILMDENNKVSQARLHIVEFRGFERFIQGRPYWEVPVLVQRLCGICPVSHHLAAAKAMDRIVGGENLTPTAEKIRRLMHYGQHFQSHALHFFHLCSPDLLFGFDADPAIRNVIGVAGKYPDLAVQGVMMRKYGQEVIKATAGKKIHGTGAIPGGVNKNLSVEQRDWLIQGDDNMPGIEQMMEWSRGALKIAKDYTLEHLDDIAGFGSFDSNHMGMVTDDGTMDLYHGQLRAVDAEGNTLFDQLDYQDYHKVLQEEVRNWSYMKFPFIQQLGPENGWYRVGPLARINVADRIDTPEAQAAFEEFRETTGNKPCNITMAYHWTRMIELLHSCEKIKELLNDADLQGEDLVTSGERREETVGVIEAPRGTLIHHYTVNENDEVTMANLIVSTTHNNIPMNRAVQKVAADHIDGQAEITEGLLNHVEVAIRAYDPCLSCATHALGKMPLEVSLVNAAGEVVDTRSTT
jgi:NAD-reducing hydrogenase large subunit